MAQALVESGIAHYAAGRLDEAEADMREAARLDPANIAAHANLGAILRTAGKASQALAVYDAALVLSPDATLVLANRANLLNDLRRWPEALDSANRALAGAPGHPSALNARANALLSLGERPAAVETYQEAARNAPGGLQAWFNLGKALLELGRAPEALDAYQRAVAIAPEFAAARAGVGHVLAQLKRWSDAAEAYDHAYRLDPDLPYLAGQRLHARMKVCDWRGYDAAVDDIARRIDEGARAALPFTLIAAPFSAAQQRRCAESYVADTFVSAPRPPGATPGERIRVGYFSADFHEHATAYLLAEALELHDRGDFEITAVSWGPQSGGQMRQRLEAACERFVDVRAVGSASVARMARDLKLDIAVDLKGATTYARPELFAAGLAPVQVSFLGFPMTSGAPFIDYLVADSEIVPVAAERYYSEKIARLDACYQPNDSRRTVSAVATTRREHDLPADAFVFASFNASYKITPQTFALWMELLRRVPDAVLWLLDDEPLALSNLRVAAHASLVDPRRLVPAPFRSHAEQLERLAHADLLLDTFPCGAHTTASDALWAGVPILTRRGETFASRVAASLLMAVDMPELICESEAHYRMMAIRLAGDPGLLAGLRLRLAAARHSAPLFNTRAYVDNLEKLYRAMHRRRLAGLTPDHLP